jgi:hypothetical protein
MIPDRILYTDGHDVVVTDSTFQVKKNSYSLDGITKHGMYILKPQRLPAVMLLLAGIVIAFCGAFNVIPDSINREFYFGDYAVSGATLMIITGALLAVVAILIVGLTRERYAVRIATAEGEKNAIVSSRKEYITQILDAMNQAYNYLRMPRKTNTIETIFVKND